MSFLKNSIFLGLLSALVCAGCVIGTTPSSALNASRSLGPAQTTPLPAEAQVISADDFLNNVNGGYLRVTNNTAQFPVATSMPTPRSLAQSFQRPAMEESLHQALKARAKRIFGQPRNQAVISKMMARAKQGFQPKRLANPPTDCSQDIGSGSVGSDRSANDSYCTSFYPTGLYANFDFSLKNDSTCIKDQGTRGTCVAFATVAAVESLVAVMKGQSVNLSEQHLYSYYKNWWEPDSLSDGADDGTMWDSMIQNNYVIPYEQIWDYNPSLSRVSAPDGVHFEDSCADYDETCTDSTHQSGLYCATLSDRNLYCGYMAPINTNGTGVRVTEEAELWNANDPSGSQARIQTALDGYYPVVLGIEITPSFEDAAYGYVPYSSANEVSRGGHAVELLGYVDNLAISQKLGDQAPPGAGGGYFIAKNSWSRCLDDSGYIYIPYAWVQAHTFSATVLTSLEEF